MTNVPASGSSTGGDPPDRSDWVFGRAFRWALEQGHDEQTALEIARLTPAEYKRQLEERAAVLAAALQAALEDEAAERRAMLSIDEQLELWLWRRPGVTPESLVGLTLEERTQRLYPYRWFLVRSVAAGPRAQVEYAERIAALVPEYEARRRPPEPVAEVPDPFAAPCRAWGCKATESPHCEGDWDTIVATVQDLRRKRLKPSRIGIAKALRPNDVEAQDAWLKRRRQHFKFENWAALLAAVPEGDRSPDPGVPPN